MILQAISKIYLWPNYGVESLFKMLTLFQHAVLYHHPKYVTWMLDNYFSGYNTEMAHSLVLKWIYRTYSRRINFCTFYTVLLLKNWWSQWNLKENDITSKDWMNYVQIGSWYSKQQYFGNLVNRRYVRVFHIDWPFWFKPKSPWSVK